MALAKKASRRYSSRFNYKRWYRRRRYRRRYRKRYYRRNYKKPEYKRIEETRQFQWHCYDLRDPLNLTGNAGDFYVMTKPYYFSIIGRGTDPAGALFGVDIPQGTGVNQRIGAKITPAKLKFQVSMGIIPVENTVPDDNAPGVNLYGGHLRANYNTSSSRAFKVRFIVMQVKNGNCEQPPHSPAFHQVNPALALDQPDIQFFNKAFESGRPDFQYVLAQDQWYMAAGQLEHWWNCVISNYRRGTGGQFRILKDKIYTVDSSRGSFYTFKFKTKRPSMMTWVERRDGNNGIYSYPKNPIYIIAIPFPNCPMADCKLSFIYKYNFYYTDS